MRKPSKVLAPIKTSIISKTAWLILEFLSPSNSSLSCPWLPTIVRKLFDSLLLTLVTKSARFLLPQGEVLKNCSLLPVRRNLLSSDVEYPIEMTYMSFEDEPQLDKIMVHAVESIPSSGSSKKNERESSSLIAKWILKVHRNPVQYKHIYKLTCPSN